MQQPDSDTSNELPALYVGDHVEDRDDQDATMLVTGRPLEPADEYAIDEDRTVATVNPEYPADDLVVEVCFPKRTDNEVQNCRRYAYPRSRLRRAASVHDVDDTEEDDR